MISDTDLIKLCQRNDRKGQQILFDKFKGKVMGICLRFASNRTEAEDILQEAFIKVFNSLIKLKALEIDALSAWIHRITTNTAINVYHKQRKHESVLQLDELICDELIVAETVLQEMNQEEILRLIQEMPTGCRVVFNLTMIEGFDHKEVAEKLQISESSSRSQLSRAKFWLRERLNEKEVLI